MRYGPWEKTVRKLEMMGPLTEAAVMKQMTIEGMRLEKTMRDGIRLRKYGLTALKPATIKRKKSSTPLIDKGDLINSITSKIVAWHTVFAGILRMARNRKGNMLVNIGEIHVKGLGKMPKRDFITPAVKEREKKFADNLQGAINTILKI